MALPELAQIEAIRNEFTHKINAFVPLSPQDGKDEAWRLNGIGITQAKFRAPTCIFIYNPDQHPEFPRYELWVKDPKTLIERYQPHWEVREELDEFARQNNFTTDNIPLSGYVLQDDKDKLHLTVDPYTAKDLGSRFTSDDWLRKSWTRLVEAYGISTIFGNIPFTNTFEKDGMIHSTNDVIVTKVVDQDLIGQIREDNFLGEIAIRNQMTNSQYLRLQLLTSGARDAKIPVVYENIAKEIIADDLKANTQYS